MNEETLRSPSSSSSPHPLTRLDWEIVVTHCKERERFYARRQKLSMILPNVLSLSMLDDVMSVVETHSPHHLHSEWCVAYNDKHNDFDDRQKEASKAKLVALCFHRDMNGGSLVLVFPDSSFELLTLLCPLALFSRDRILLFVVVPQAGGSTPPPGRRDPCPQVNVSLLVSCIHGEEKEKNISAFFPEKPGKCICVHVFAPNGFTPASSPREENTITRCLLSVAEDLTMFAPCPAFENVFSCTFPSRTSSYQTKNIFLSPTQTNINTGNYGLSLMDEFKNNAHEKGICIATTETLINNAPDHQVDQTLKSLLQYKSTARVVVCFCEGMTVRSILKGIRRLGVHGELVLFGSDGWADRYEVVHEYEDEAIGGISVRIHSSYIDRFDHHYFSLHPDTNNRNPWFREFWEFRFNCTLPPIGTSIEEAMTAAKAMHEAAAKKAMNSNNSTYPMSPFDPRAFRFCTGREDLSKGYSQDTKMAFVMKSIWTMAHGLHNMQQDLCPKESGLCQAMLPVNGSLLLSYLMNVTFKWGNENVYFDSSGDPPGRYDIMNLQFMPRTGRTEYVQVGSWSFISDQKTFEMFHEMQWPRRRGVPFFSYPNGSSTDLIPESVCSKPCPKGQVKVSGDKISSSSLSFFF